MNRLSFISGIVVFFAATFLITNTSNTTMAFSCSSSSSTPHANTQTGVSGQSGSCSTSSSGSTRTCCSTLAGIAHAVGNGPISESSALIAESRYPPPPSFELGTSASAGGAQSSCSSSSASSTTLQFGTGPPIPGISVSSSSTSKPGSCP
jgi:hypothetical protein